MDDDSDHADVAQGPAQSANDNGTFSLYQPAYAAHGIATFPVRIVECDGGKIDKVPATKGYLRTGIRGSTALARKFVDADAFGIVCGKPNKLTVLDVDTTDENVLANALSRHGHTPIIIRTASGKWHAYFRHNRERRKIRPDRNVPIEGPDRLGERGVQSIAKKGS